MITHAFHYAPAAQGRPDAHRRAPGRLPGSAPRCRRGSAISRRPAAADERARLTLGHVARRCGPAAARRPRRRRPPRWDRRPKCRQDLAQVAVRDVGREVAEAVHVHDLALPLAVRHAGARPAAGADAGSSASGPTSSIGIPRARWPATGPNTSRPWNVGETWKRNRPALVMAWTRAVWWSARMWREEPVVGADEAMRFRLHREGAPRRARRRDRPRPGRRSRSGRPRRRRRARSAPPRTSCGGRSCTMSTIWRVRAHGQDGALHRPDVVVLGTEVGKERDDGPHAADCREKRPGQ